MSVYMHVCMCDYIYINEFTHTYIVYVYESSVSWYHEKVYLLKYGGISSVLYRVHNCLSTNSLGMYSTYIYVCVCFEYYL